jgi:hypothetical protein
MKNKIFNASTYLARNFTENKIILAENFNYFQKLFIIFILFLKKFYSRPLTANSPPYKTYLIFQKAAPIKRA